MFMKRAIDFVFTDSLPVDVDESCLFIEVLEEIVPPGDQGELINLKNTLSSLLTLSLNPVPSQSIKNISIKFISLNRRINCHPYNN